MTRSLDDFDPFAPAKPSLDSFDPFAAPTIPRPTQAAPAAPLPLPGKSGLLRRVVGDSAIDVGKGIVDLGQAAVGAADLVSGGHAGKALESVGYDPTATNAALSDLYSPERQKANQAVNDAHGFLPTVKAMLQNPSTIAGSVLESAPSTLGGGAGLARGIAGKALPLIGKIAPVIAGGIGEGAIQAGQSAEQSRAASPDKLLSGKAATGAVASGAMDALISSLGGATAQKLGIADIDTLLAGGKTIAKDGKKGVLGALKRALEGVVQEGVLEELPQSAQEQMWQNYATNQPLMQGVPEAAAQGAITGAVQGGGTAAALPGHQAEAKKEGVDTPVDTPANATSGSNSTPLQPAPAVALSPDMLASQPAPVAAQPAINPDAGPLSRVAAKAQEVFPGAQPGTLAAVANDAARPVPAHVDPTTGEYLPPSDEALKAQIHTSMEQQLASRGKITRSATNVPGIVPRRMAELFDQVKAERKQGITSANYGAANVNEPALGSLQAVADGAVSDFGQHGALDAGQDQPGPTVLPASPEGDGQAPAAAGDPAGEANALANEPAAARAEGLSYNREVENLRQIKAISDRQGLGLDVASMASPELAASGRLSEVLNAPTYDTSDQLEQSDITPPSGEPFTHERAAELQAKRHEGGKVFPVEGGYVVRVPQASGSAQSSPMQDQSAVPASAEPTPSTPAIESQHAASRAGEQAASEAQPSATGAHESQPAVEGGASATPAVAGEEGTRQQDQSAPVASRHQQADGAPTASTSPQSQPASGLAATPAAGQASENTARSQHAPAAAEATPSKAESQASSPSPESATAPAGDQAPDEFYRAPKANEKGGTKAVQRAIGQMPAREGYTGVYKPYGEKGAGFYYVKNAEQTAPAANPQSTAPAHPAPVPPAPTQAGTPSASTKGPAVPVTGESAPASGGEGATVKGEGSVKGISQAEYDRIAALPANKRTDADIAAANAFSREQKRPAQEAAAAAEKAKQDALNNVDGFADHLPPMQRQKKIDALNHNVRVKGQIITRKAHIRDMVARGSRVGMIDGRRALVHKSGSFTLEKDISKTALDYAEHLTKQQAATPKAEPSAANPKTEQQAEPTPQATAANKVSDQPTKSKAEAKADPLASQTDLFKRLANGEATLAEYKAGWQELQDNRDAVLAHLATMKKTELLELAGPRYRNDPKPAVIRAAMSGLEGRYGLYRSLTFGMTSGHSQRDAQAAQVEGTTEADLKAFADKIAESRKAREQRVAGAKDPTTLSEFQDAARLAGGEANLTPDQRAKFDALRAEARREQREADAKRNAVVRQVNTTTGMELVETKHTQKGHDLFVVKMAERVDGDTYTALNSAAKRLGGHYSSYRGNGAVPGFTFTTREAAQQFMAVRDGNVDASGQQQARQEAKAEHRAETLSEKAAALREKAEASLNRDRKDNTNKRAAQAASAEAEARKDIATADTMARIGKAIEAGKAKMLAFVRAKTQVDLLDRTLRAAHWETLRGQGVNWEKAKEQPITAAAITNATLPKFYLSRGDAIRVARRLVQARGGKALGLSLGKEVDYGDEYGKAVQDNPFKFVLGVQRSDGSGGSAVFATKRDADAVLARSAEKAKGTVVKLPDGFIGDRSKKWAVALAPDLAIERKLWAPDYDKKVHLSPAGAEKIMDVLGINERSGDQQVPYWWASHLAERAAWARMGIETNYEMREALREYLALREEPAEEDRIRKLERGLIGKDAGFDFFPTPPEVVSRLIEQADVGPGMRVLEPSAGKGDIAEALRDSADDVTVDTVEMSNTLKEILEAKGFDPQVRDFMEVKNGPVYDRIVMNPPFGNDSGASHVQHAYSMLKPGGRLVAVMGLGQRGKEAFNAWLDKVGGLSEPLPEGSFKSSFRPTGVATQVVVIDKSATALENTEELTAADLTPAEREAFDRASNTSEAKQKAEALSKAQGEADAHARGFFDAMHRVMGDQAERVKFVRDYAGLPEEMRDGVIQRNKERADAGGNVVTGALYDPASQDAYIITSVVKTPDRAVWNAIHEIGGHDGIRKLLGDKLNAALHIALQNPTVNALAKAIHIDRKYDDHIANGSMTKEGARLLAAEEALAELQAAIRTGDYDHIQSRYGVEVGQGIREQQSLKAAIANFLKRLQSLLNDLFGRPVFLDEDVRQLLDAAFQASQSEGATIGGMAESTSGDAQTVEIPAGRSGRVTHEVPRYWYHSLRGDRELGPNGEITPYDHRENKYHAEGFKDSPTQMIHLSREPYTANAIRIDVSKLDLSRMRLTGQAEGHAVYAGTIPREAMASQSDGTVSGDMAESTSDERLTGTKAVDANGEPLTVYHGTPGNMGNKPITKFAKQARGGLGGAIGFWFASERQAAQVFARERFAGVKPQIVEAKLAIKNPMEYDGHQAFVAAANARAGSTIEDRLKSLRRSLVRAGYDGVVVRNSDTDQGGVRDDWVAFEPHQVIITPAESGSPSTPSANHGSAEPGASVLENVEPIAKRAGEHSQEVIDDVEAVMNAGQDKTLLERAKAKLASLVPAKIKDQYRPTWLAVLTTPHLTELGSDYLPGMGHYDAFLKSMNADRNELQQQGEEVSEDMRQWGSKNPDEAQNLFKLAHQATIDGVDPAKEYQPLQFRYSGKLHEVNPKNIREAIKQINQQIRERSGDSKQDLQNEIKKLRTMLKAEPGRVAQYPALLQKWIKLGETGARVYQVVGPDGLLTAHFATADAAKADATARGDGFYTREVSAGQHHYIAMRDMYSQRSQMIEDGLVARIEDTDAPANHKQRIISMIRMQFETQRLQGVYFPLQRFGQYFVAATKGDDRVFLMFESLNKLESGVKNLKNRGFTISAQGLKSQGKAVDAPSGTYVADVIQILRDAHISEATQDAIYQTYLQSLPELSMRKHAIHRQAVPGFDPDAVRAFAFNMLHGAHQIARLRWAHKLADTITLLRAQQEANRTQPDADTRKIAAGDAILNELELRHQWIMNPTDSKATGIISSFGFIYYLGLTPAGALINMTQVALLTFPFLAARHGPIRAMNHLMAGMRDSIMTGGHIQKRLTDPGELAMHKELQRRGALDKTQSFNLAGIAEGGLAGHNPQWAKAMQIIGMPFHKAEVVNREASSIAAYRLTRADALADGKDAETAHNMAVDAAARAVNDTHFDYTNQSRARVMQSGTAKTLLMFRQYSLNMTWHLGRMLWQATKNEDAEVKKIARRNLAGVLGMSALFSGAMGLPLMSVTFGVLNAIAASFGNPDEPWDAETEFKAFLDDMFGKGGGDLVANGGINALTGADIASRVSLSQLWFRDADRELDGRGAYYNLLEQAAGPMGGVLKNALVGKQMIDEGHVMRGIETMLPKALKDTIKAQRYATEGVNNLRGDPLVKDVSLRDLLLQFSGFTPDDVASQYDVNRSLKNYEQAILDRRSYLLDAFAMALRTEDDDARSEVLAKIRHFNETNPEIAITTKGIRQSMASRARYSADAENGISLNRKLAAKVHNAVEGDG